ncbi:MAG: hypothetical protein COB67_02395 [SAR324 cluster bacterium]|uniref:Uncharacterized protein n=1 Tax=SAR324 cluster bacterium TaxID=2024889 RepID=A0A2A4T9W0_9DELT|nr:MAG: hypothetical protein COB67_02395 [SAR324 cluster bacterium]
MKVNITNDLKKQMYIIGVMAAWAGVSLILTFFTIDNNESFLRVFSDLMMKTLAYIMGISIIGLLLFSIYRYFKDNITIEK